MTYMGADVADLNARCGRVVDFRDDHYLISWEDGKVRWYSAWVTGLLVENAKGQGGGE